MLVLFELKYFFFDNKHSKNYKMSSLLEFIFTYKKINLRYKIKLLFKIHTDIMVNEDSMSGIFLTKAIVSILVCIVGLVGNILSIYVVLILKDYKKSVLHM